MSSVLVYRDKAAASAAAATLLAAGIIEKPASVLGLDCAPELVPIYRTVARMTTDGLLDWGCVKTFNLYEYVRADAENSVDAQLSDVLLSRVNLPDDGRYMPNASGSDWSVVCNDYENLILDAGGLDAVVCSVRSDGSVAFNLGASELAPVTHVERTETGRIVTVGMTTIMSAKKIIAVMTGRDKANMAPMVLNGPIVPAVPASYLQLHANVIFIMDEDAADMI